MSFKRMCYDLKMANDFDAQRSCNTCIFWSQYTSIHIGFDDEEEEEEFASRGRNISKLLMERRVEAGILSSLHVGVENLERNYKTNKNVKSEDQKGQ